MTDSVDATGVLALHQECTGIAVLERWTDSGATTIGTVTNAGLGSLTSYELAMPTASSLVYGNLSIFSVKL